MKNKLLVSVFAVGIAVFALTSCETKSNVTEVCTDLVKESMHKTPRSLQQLDGETLTIYEYEFASKNINDPGLIYRKLTFGNKVPTEEKVVKSTYAYGEWQAQNTTYTIHVTPSSDMPPYTLKFRGNAFITPEGQVIGGEGTDNMARVEKWEKVIATLPNTDWAGLYEGKFVMDSIFRDSIRKTFIPPMTIKYDTIQVFDHMDTVAADTTCTILIAFDRDPATNENTGHYYRRAVRSEYDRKTKESTIITEEIKEYDFNWFFSDVTSDAKFVVEAKSTTEGVAGEKLSIAKYKLDEAGEASEFLLGGITFERPVVSPTNQK